MHLDMDAFFASVELLRYPMLKGLPVVVGGRQIHAPVALANGGYQFTSLRSYAGRGVVTTATYEARALGVHSAMPLMKARQLAPDAVLLPANFAAYQKYSKQFKSVVKKITPVIENRGVDEIFIDATKINMPTLKLAKKLQKEILQSTGLSCSIGVAPNKLLAKIASDFKKPGGITVLQQYEVAEKIWPLPVEVINGIGPKAQKKLNGLGIKTVGQLADAAPALLQHHFGTNYARWLLKVAYGQDDSPVETVRIAQSHSRETTFHRDLHVQNDRRALGNILWQLCERLEQDLKKADHYAKNVEIKLRFDNFLTQTRSMQTAKPINQARWIRYYARQNLRRVDLHNKKLRLMGVKVAQLIPASQFEQKSMHALQLSLYDE